MRHLLFPSKEQADAFIEDLRAQGVIQPEVGRTTLNRRSADAMDGGAGTMGTGTTTTTTTRTEYADDDVVAEAAGGGAVAGTGVGAAVGATAGIIGTAATVATGGLALPVILGMTALGSGVGAAVGAIGGAAGAEDASYTGGTYASSYDVSGEQYDRLSGDMADSGRAIAVEDSVPTDAVEAAAARHGGQFV